MLCRRPKIFGLLLIALSLAGFARAANKSSDIVTCTTAAATDTLQFDHGFWQQAEYARFGLIFCKPRLAAPRNVDVELSSRGVAQVRFFALSGSGKGPDEPDWNPHAIAQRLSLPPTADWKSLLDEMRSKGKLKTTLEGTLVLANEGLWFGYVASLRGDQFARSETDIMYSAGAMETEKLETFPLERTVRSLDKFLDMVLSFGTNLLGVLVGALISYIFFRRQQRVIVQQDEARLFRQRKLEKAEELLTFFGDVYSQLYTQEDSLEAVRKIRRALVLAGIYSLLPLEAMDRINVICESKSELPAPRGRMLDDLLRSHFGELMAVS